MGQGLFTFKLYFLLLYGAFGLTCLILAGADGRPIFPRGEAVRRTTFGVAPIASLAVVVLVGFVLRGSLMLVEATVIAAIAFAVSAGAKASLNTVAAGIASGCVVLSLVWWQMRPVGGTPTQLFAFAALLAGFSFAIADPGRRRERFVILPATVFALAGLALMGDLGTYRAADPMFGLAHHWGAFIGPALHVRAGLVPFYDVPLQYGLGPTLAIAATCDGNDCWRGAQAFFTAASLANGLLVLAMALTAVTRRGWAWQCGMTAIVFAAVFLWPGFASEGNSFLGYPSSAGTRFLPLTLVAALLFFGHARAAIAAMIPALLWSPESAAMSAVVFGVAGTARYGFLRAAALTAALLVGSYGALFLAHRLVYGVWIDPLALIEYVLHVPGPLPIDPFSDILLLAATLALGGWLIYRAPRDPQTGRRDLVATILLFAASSYCLGRSHPNNICNLGPFLVLVATRALDRAGEDFSTARKATGFGLAVSVAALAFSPWTTKPFVIPPVIDMHDIVDEFPTLQPDVARLRKDIPAGLGIADFGPALIRDPSETLWWTPMDPSSLWSYVPGARRQIYIARSAAKLRRAGWAIVVDRQLFLMNDLTSAYTVSNRREFQGGPLAPGTPPLHYTIACFTPKPELVRAPIGASCPAP